MTLPLRILTLALLLTGTEWLAACNKKADSTPQPQAQVQTGAVVGQATPAAALTSATATPTGGGTAYPAAVNAATGQYTFANLPEGNYAVTYVVAAGYPTPTAQAVIVTAGATATLPTLTLQLNPVLLLTNRNWVLTAQRISPSISLGGGTITDLYAQLSACSKDDFIRFETPNVLKIDEGPTKCNSSDPQTQTGTWNFNGSQSVITVVLQGQSQDLAVVNLTDTSLIFTTTQTAGGITYTVTNTYRKN